MNNNYIKVSIKGRNVNNYIKWLIKQKLEINKINIINQKELEVLVHYKDYKKLKKYSKTYKINVIRKYGLLRLKETISNNKIIIISVIICIFILNYLSNIVFSIDIISNNQEWITFLNKELDKNDIKKYKLKKNYREIEIIKNKILEDNKDVLEWLEIIESGTKYIVRYVERKKEVKESEYDYQSITSSKNAIITEIKAYNGEKIKDLNEYVKKNETIISGVMEKTDGTKIYTKGKGIVYGEVWYKIEVEYPYIYHEEKVTGNHKKVFFIELLNRKIPIFPYKKYRNFKNNKKYIYENPLELLKFSYEELYEVIVYEDIYTKDEVIDKAIEKASTKLLENNNKIVEIKNIIILDKIDLNSKIKLNLFFSVKEDITKVVEIKKELLEEKTT